MNKAGAICERASEACTCDVDLVGMMSWMNANAKLVVEYTL